MSAPTYQELAESLGLEPGMDVGPARIRTEEEIDRHMQLRARLMAQEVSAGGSGSLKSFWHHLGALYLPSLLRTFFEPPFNPITINSDPVLAKHWTSLMFLISKPDMGRHFQRFIREKPEEVIGWMHAQAQRMVDLETQLDREAGDPLFHSMMMITTYLTGTLNSAIPINQLGPLIRGTSLPTTRALVPRFKRLRSRCPHPSMVTLVETTAGLLEHSLLPKGLEPPQDRMEYKVQMGVTCGLYPDGAPSGVKCVMPEKGKEMAECAGCHVVRYCSREHQKADWKAHKPACIRPSW